MLDFHVVFDASPNAYMLLDRDLRYVAANRAYLRETASTIEDIVGRHVTDAFPDGPDSDNARRLVASLERVLATKKPDVLPVIPYRILVDGVWQEHVWSATHTPIVDEHGVVQHILQHTVKVTTFQSERDREGVLTRAHSVQERNDELMRMFAQAPGFLAMLRAPDWTFELANPAYIALVGGRDVVGKRLLDVLPELAHQGFVELLETVRTSAKAHVGRATPVLLQRTAGVAAEEVFVDFVYQPILDAQGNVSGIVAQGSDVTAQVRAQRRIERTNAELEAIFASFPEALFIGRASGIERSNDAAARLYGYGSYADLQARDPREVFDEIAARHADTRAPVTLAESPFLRALQGETSRLETVVKVRGTDEERYVLSSAAPVRVGDEVTGALVAQIDITRSRRAEAESRRLARVLDETHDFVGIADVDGRPMFVNEAGRELVGLPSMADARNTRVVDYFVERDRARVAAEVFPTATRDGWWQGELTFRHFESGAEIPVLYSLFPLVGAGGVVEAYATITRDLRGQRAAEAERLRLLDNERSARAQAEEANRLKDEFLAVVSHELRTPLTAILGWVEMLKSDTIAPEKRARGLQIVERNARVQAQLVDDLLDVSRIMSGKLALDLDNVDVAAVAHAAAETVRPAADARRVKLAVDVRRNGVVRGDAHRLQQVVWNLVANAVKFTPGNGEVRIVVDREGDAVTVDVHDTGAGIAPAFLPYVFEPFRQAEGGAARRAGGLGLGLAIVRHLAQAHGGDVAAASAGEGKGSTFSVRLPAVAAPARADGSTVALAHEPALDGVHVLVVDDEPDTREYVRALLERCHARVTEASDAAAALSLLKRERPSVLLSDIGMPGEDGYHLIQDVRALPDDEGGDTPAVALTAYARPTDRARAMMAGFQNHVTKPIEPAELLAALAALAPHRRARA